MANPTDPDASLLNDYFGDLNPAWVPDVPPISDGRRYVVVATPKVYGDPMYGAERGVAIDQATTSWLRVVLYSQQTGAPLEICVGNYSVPPTVQVRYREASGFDPRVFDPDVGDTPGLAPDGKSVLLPIPEAVKSCPGVYAMQARVIDATGLEVARTDVLVLTQRGMWTTDGSSSSDQGPPTIQEVRTAMRDHPASNRLLGDFINNPAEIGQAIVSAVQAFQNEPPINPYRLTTVTFPSQWRRQALDGILAYLCETQAAICRASSLPYTAGGVAINDLDREKQYLAAAQMYRERFQRWCRIQKQRMSIQAGWGTLWSGVTTLGTL